MPTSQNIDINTIVAHRTGPWESVLPLLQYIEPIRQPGIQVLYVNQGPQWVAYQYA